MQGIQQLLKTRKTTPADIIFRTVWEAVFIAVPRTDSLTIECRTVRVGLTCSANWNLWSRIEEEKIYSNENYYYDRRKDGLFHNYFFKLLSTLNNCVRTLFKEFKAAPKLLLILWGIGV